MHIRSARTDDMQACLAVDLSYETEYAWQIQEERRDKEWQVSFREVRLPRAQRITPHVNPEDHLKVWERCDGFWVVTEKTQILGYLTLRLEPDHAQARLIDLAVDAAYRRQGLGTQLLNHAIAWLARQGEMDQVVLECPPKAHPAISFALKQGFTLCGFQDSYWPGQELGLFFRKRLR